MVNVVTGYGNEVGAALVNHPLVAKVAFTGGSESGAIVYQAAARDLKRCSLDSVENHPTLFLTMHL